MKNKIILSNIAKNGVKDAVLIKDTKEQKERYEKLAKEADERIKLSHIKRTQAYIDAKNYIAKYIDAKNYIAK